MNPKNIFSLLSVSLLSACLSAPPTSTPVESVLPSPQSAPDIARVDTLEARVLACAVRASNPSLRAWSERLRAEGLGASQVRTLEDTKVSYAFAPGSIFSSNVDYGQVITIEQGFVLGQTRLRRSVARLEADATRHGLEARSNQLERLSALLLAEYYALVRALESNREFEALAKDTIAIVDAHYSNGHGTQQDPIRAELELTHVMHERLVLESQLRIVRAQLNGLLHRPVDAELPELPERLGEGSDAGEGQRPELAGAEARIASARERENLAARGYAPRLSAQASYNSMWHDPAHRVMLGVGLRVPLQGRAIAADRERAAHETRSIEHERDALADDIAVEVEVARARLAEAHHVRKLHDTQLIPSARERVEAARIAYENHEAPLSDLIAAERELRTLELHVHRLDADLFASEAELRYALGVQSDCSTTEASDV